MLRDDVMREVRHDATLDKGSFQQTSRTVSLRSWVISVCVIVFLASVNLRGYLTQSFATLNIQVVPATAPYAIVLLCMLANMLLTKVAKRKGWALRADELIAVYIGTSIGGLVLSDAFVSLVATMVAGVPQVMLAWGAEDVIGDFLSRASSLVLLKDEDAMWLFWFGGSEVPWQRWVAPVLLWTLLYSCIFFVFLCMICLVRRQWQD